MEIEAKDQARLGAGRCFQLAWNGMSYRLFRSGITVAILGLAVAFLSHSLIHGLIAGSSERSAYREVEGQRRLATMISRFLRSDSQTAVIDDLAAGHPERLAEYRVWGAATGAVLAQAVQSAGQVKQIEREFARLSPENRAVVVGELNVPQLLERLGDMSALQLFMERLAQTGIGPPVGGEAKFREVVRTGWPELQQVIAEIRQGHDTAVDGVAAAFPGQSVQKILAEHPERLRPILTAHGFATESLPLDALSRYASRALARQAVQEALSVPAVRATLVRELNIAPDDLSLMQVFDWLRAAPDRAEKLAAQFRKISEVSDITVQRLRALAEYYPRFQRLQEIAGDVPPAPEGAFLGLHGRMKWLLPLAFLVCVVGVANAMFMSVTERFTEIATMKCLGALDGFVMLMFVFEAAIQGVLGAVAGILLGGGLAFVRAWAEYGMLMTFEPGIAGQIALAATLSLATGILLAVVAAVGPSYLAARLAPMEAMRVE